jgi:hypothetical protein
VRLPHPSIITYGGWGLGSEWVQWEGVGWLNWLPTSHLSISFLLLSHSSSLAPFPSLRPMVGQIMAQWPRVWC